MDRAKGIQRALADGGGRVELHSHRTGRAPDRAVARQCSQRCSAPPTARSLVARWSFTLLLFGREVLPAVHFRFEIAAVLLSSKQSTSPIRFFQLPSRSAPNEVETDFHRLLKRGGGRGRYGYVHRDPVLPGESLAFAKHDPDLLLQKDDLAGYGGTVTLGTLFDISRGQFRPLRAEEVTSGEQGPDTVRIISGRDITRRGLIAPTDDDSRWANVPPESCLRVGDVVLRAVHSPADSGGLIVAEVTELDLPLVGTHTVLTLRAKIPFDEPDWLVILQFLRTPLAQSLVFASSGSGVHLLTCFCKLWRIYRCCCKGGVRVRWSPLPAARPLP
jgi:hypothetical protein